MRDQGRCAGCKKTGPLKPISAHVITCADWAALYRENPGAALSAAEEFARWSREERQAEHAAGLALRIADTEGRRALSVARFKVKDPLED